MRKLSHLFRQKALLPQLIGGITPAEAKMICDKNMGAVWDFSGKQRNYLYFNFTPKELEWLQYLAGKPQTAPTFLFLLGQDYSLSNSIPVELRFQWRFGFLKFKTCSLYCENSMFGSSHSPSLLIKNDPLQFVARRFYRSTGSSRLMLISLLQISSLRFFKTISKIWLMQSYGLFILLPRT